MASKVEKMNTTNKSANFRLEGNTLFLEGVLDFDTVPALLPRLKSTLKPLNAVVIDLSAVTYTNSAGVALLLDMLRKSQAQKINITFNNIPQDMQDIITLSGLQDVLVHA
jgi:phospholipid transport system transporter-binding protein